MCPTLQENKLGTVYFYKDFRDAFPQVWEDFFEDFFRQVGVYPLYELTAGIIQRFGCEKYFPQYQGFFMHLLELVKMQEARVAIYRLFWIIMRILRGKTVLSPWPRWMPSKC